MQLLDHFSFTHQSLMRILVHVGAIFDLCAIFCYLYVDESAMIAATIRLMRAGQKGRLWGGDKTRIGIRRRWKPFAGEIL